MYTDFTSKNKIKKKFHVVSTICLCKSSFKRANFALLDELLHREMVDTPWNLFLDFKLKLYYLPDVF